MPRSCAEVREQTPDGDAHSTVELLGDRWTLLVIRDIMICNRRRYCDLLSMSEEGITRNLLTSRLVSLLEKGMLTETPARRLQGLFSLTEKSIQLVPVLARICIWAGENLGAREINSRAGAIVYGGPKRWLAFMDELRQLHLDSNPAHGNAARNST
ncbi:MAG TPA: winged helix-turn-helix transcriptional regulator [Steroidobacteraceae bacterium]|jgi:DNA-binding HxlR family transcriptional regulator